MKIRTTPTLHTNASHYNTIQSRSLDLPDDVLESVFRKLDETDRVSAARACKRFASLVPRARRGAALPTRLELLDFGCPRPDAQKVLAAFSSCRGDVLPEPHLMKHYAQLAALQVAIQAGVAASFLIGSRVYTGGAARGVPNGFGWYEYSNGRYEGELKNGKRHGYGITNFADGTRHEGGWKEGELHGRGIGIRPNGERYEGAYREDARCGHGVLTGADGSRYEGEFKNGKRHGRGALTRADGSRFVGEFRDGMPLGEQPPQRGKVRSRLLGCFSGA